MGILNQAEIRELHEAIVSAGLGDSRTALLAGLAPGFIAALPRVQPPGEQLLVDLNAINDAGTLVDGTVPLVQVARNALTLAGSRREEDLFRCTLQVIEKRVAKKTPASGTSRSRAPTPPRAVQKAVGVLNICVVIAAMLVCICIIVSGRLEKKPSPQGNVNMDAVPATTSAPPTSDSASLVCDPPSVATTGTLPPTPIAPPYHYPIPNKSLAKSTDCDELCIDDVIPLGPTTYDGERPPKWAGFSSLDVRVRNATSHVINITRARVAIVSVECPPPPNSTYEPSNSYKASIDEDFPVRHVLKPGEVDSFTIVIKSSVANRCRYMAMVNLRYNGDHIVWSEKFRLR